MRLRTVAPALVVLALVGAACGDNGPKDEAATTSTSSTVVPEPPVTTPTGPRLVLHSASFADGAPMPPRHAGGDQDLSPPLDWSGVPAEAKELALICEDPDAPDRAFVHWVLAGIDPATTHLEEGDVPDGVLEGMNDFGEAGWAGPQPPPGDPPHHYVFSLVALDQPLGLDGRVTAAQLRKAMNGKVIAEGRLTATFDR